MSGASYRVDANLLKGDWWILLLLVFDIGLGLWALPRMPAQAPLIWSAGGPRLFGPAWAGAFWPAIVAVLAYLYQLVGPLTIKKMAVMAAHPSAHRKLRGLLVAALTFFQMAMIYMTLSYYV